MADDINLGDLTPMDPIQPPDYQMPVINPFPDMGTLDPNDPLGMGSTAGQGGGGSSGSNSLGSLARLLGLTGSNGSLNSSGLLQLLSMLGLGAGAFMSHNATNQATGQMTSAINDANNKITGILGGAQSNYQPYIQAGQNALGKAQTIGYKPMAGNFQPIQASAAAPPYAGAGQTLGSLLRR